MLTYGALYGYTCFFIDLETSTAVASPLTPVEAHKA
jgi:hypothetical protein